jgi:mRNA interferase HigB
MRILSRKKIRDAAADHGEWAASLEAWYRITRGADWSNFQELRQSLGSADRVGSCVVFNISHNRCRLVSYINFRSRKVFILWILSHSEYSKGGWKDDCDCD